MLEVDDGFKKTPRDILNKTDGAEVIYVVIVD